MLLADDFYIYVRIKALGAEWRFTGFYDHLDATRREDLWWTLRKLGSVNTLPWLVVGDFNEILWPHEKVGGFARRNSHMVGFKAVLVDASLEDLGFSGSKYTLSKTVAGVYFVQELLDRAVSNGSWQQLSPLCCVRNFYFAKYDHFGVEIQVLGRYQLVPRIW